MNKFFTTLNQRLDVQFYSLTDPSGNPQYYSTLEGIPLGTSTNASDGEIGAKVIIIADRSASGPAGSGDSGLPYGADEQDLDYVSNTYLAGPATIIYKKGGVTLKTRTFTYNGSGGTNVNDQLTSTVDT